MTHFLDRDVWRVAKLLIDRYGDNAGLQAAQRADELLDEGDMAGQAVWISIKNAVDELLRTDMRPGERMS